MSARQTGSAAGKTTTSKTGRCPICGKPSQAETRPFCSRRCADVDLSRWLGGVYRIPVGVPDEEADEGRRPPEEGAEDDAS